MPNRIANNLQYKLKMCCLVYIGIVGRIEAVLVTDLDGLGLRG